MKIKLANDEQLSVCTLKDNVQGCLVIDADGKIEGYMASDAKIQKIYNEAGTDALDDKGQLFMPGTTGNYFVYNGNTYAFASGPTNNKYEYYTDSSHTEGLFYFISAGDGGKVCHYHNGSTSSAIYTIAKNLNPLNGDDLGPTTPVTGIAFYPLITDVASVVYANFALESMPSRVIEASAAYVIGDLLSDSDKAYRCISAYTSATPPVALSTDTTHWVEIPVLSQKMDAGTHIKELYNSSEAVKCDGEGQMFVSSQSGNYWVVDNDETYIYAGFYDGLDHWKYNDWNEIRYNRQTGEIIERYNEGTWYNRRRATVISGLNPTLGDKIPSLPTVDFRYGTGAIFTELATRFPQSPNDFFARVSDLAAFDSTKSYSVGDIVGYQSMVYKCTTAHSGAWTAADFTLATKAEVQAYLAGVYEKPQSGIPKSDLASSVQTSLDKADAALPTSDAEVALSQKQDKYTAWVVTMTPPSGVEMEAIGQPTYNALEDGWTQRFKHREVGETDWSESSDTAQGGLDATSITGAVFTATRSIVLDGKFDKTGGEVTGRISVTGSNAAVAVGGETNAAILTPARIAVVRPNGSSYTMYGLTFPEATGTIALAAGTGHEGNLAALDADGNLTDSGKKSADFMAANAKMTLLYNAEMSKRTNSDGQIFASSGAPAYFRHNGANWKYFKSREVTKTIDGSSVTFTEYLFDWSDPGRLQYANKYWPVDGTYRNYLDQVNCTCTPNKNPAAGDNLGPTSDSEYTFTPATIVFDSSPSDFFARISDLAAFDSTKSYSVGDIVGYQSMVYKCTTAHSGAWAAADFTLASKAEVQAYLAGVVASIDGKQDALTFDNTPTAGSVNPVTSGGIKTAIDNIKVQKVYNAAGTDALDDKGQLFRSNIVSDTGNYFYRVGYGPSPFGTTIEGTYDGVYQTIYLYGGDSLAYIPSSGNIYRWYRNIYQELVVDTGTLRMTATPNLNPTLPGVDLAPQQVQGEATWTFTPRTIVSTMLSAPYAHFALESLPDREYSISSTYAIGDIVKYHSPSSAPYKAYRCSTAITTAESWTSAHWTEIPVLAQKEDSSNKVTSLSEQSTDTQYPTAKCVYDALASVGGKPIRIYNEAGTDALDDKGQLYMAGEVGNYFTVNGEKYSYYNYSNGYYEYRNDLETAHVDYQNSSGKVFIPTSIGYYTGEYAYIVATQLNPVNGDDLSPTSPVEGWQFQKKENKDAAINYSKFAVESVPTRNIAIQTYYAVGDLLGDNGKAYRCKSAYTTPNSSPTLPSLDTAHWTEIPTLDGISATLGDIETALHTINYGSSN